MILNICFNDSCSQFPLKIENFCSENYPELKADQNFMALQDQLEGTENRITVARQRFNDGAKTYNTKIRSFPTNIIANMSGFEKKAYFSASAEAQTAPQVAF